MDDTEKQKAAIIKETSLFWLQPTFLCSADTSWLQVLKLGATVGLCGGSGVGGSEGGEVVRGGSQCDSHMVIRQQCVHLRCAV